MTNESQQQLDVPKLVLEAVERCQDYLSPTPLEYSMYLREKTGGEVWLKLDSMRTNRMVEMETFPTLADTCAGGVDLDSITLELCQRHVEEILLLTETEIEESIRLLFEEHRLVVEGSGALSVGGLLKQKERFRGKKVVAAVCGRNVDLEVFKRIIQ